MPERLRLGGEIAVTYLRAWRELRRAPIASVVATLRLESLAEAAPRVVSSSAAPPGEGSPDAAPVEEARRLGWVVARTLTLMPGDTRCLVRSLVLTRLLARRGIPSTLVIGARAAPDFLAHAWVECEGQPVLSPGDGSLGRLVEL